MTPEEHIRRLRESNAEFKRWFDHVLPHLAGAEAVEHFKESFQNEGFTDEVLVKWQDVQRRTNPKRVDRAAASRPILTGSTGDLGRSIDYTAQPGEVVVKSDTMGAGSDKDYAAAHNEGTTTAGRNRNVTIPKRQFIGKSKALDKKIEDITTREVKKILDK